MRRRLPKNPKKPTKRLSLTTPSSDHCIAFRGLTLDSENQPIRYKMSPTNSPGPTNEEIKIMNDTKKNTLHNKSIDMFELQYLHDQAEKEGGNSERRRVQPIEGRRRGPGLRY
eukprot:Pgem_evm1s10884